MTESNTQHDPSAELDLSDAPIVGVLREDHACMGCGYNLCGQQVRLDGRTKLGLVRCPECGRWHAQQGLVPRGFYIPPWVIKTAIVLWVLLLVAGFLFTGILEFALTINLTEEAGRRAGYQSHYYGTPGSYQTVYLMLGGLVALASFGVGLLMALLSGGARLTWVYLAMLLRVAIIGGISLVAIRVDFKDTPEARVIFTMWLSYYLMMQAVFGLLAIRIARPVYLWIADRFLPVPMASLARQTWTGSQTPPADGKKA